MHHTIFTLFQYKTLPGSFKHCPGRFTGVNFGYILGVIELDFTSPPNSNINSLFAPKPLYSEIHFSDWRSLYCIRMQIIKDFFSFYVIFLEMLSMSYACMYWVITLPTALFATLQVHCNPMMTWLNYYCLHIAFSDLGMEKLLGHGYDCKVVIFKWHISVTGF